MSVDISCQFWTLVDKANRLDGEAHRILSDDASEVIVDSNRMVEPAYVEIVQLVKDHPERRSEFVGCFSELALWKRRCPWMLVPFCMRALRLPEIQELLQRDMEANQGTAYYARRMNYCSSVMRAYYADVWEDATSFDFFAHELNQE